jgi:hypothetical protein
MCHPRISPLLSTASSELTDYWTERQTVGLQKDFLWQENFFDCSLSNSRLPKANTAACPAFIPMGSNTVHLQALRWNTGLA